MHREKIKYGLKCVLFSYVFCVLITGFTLLWLPKFEIEEVFLHDFREFVYLVGQILHKILPFVMVLYGLNADLNLKPRFNKVPIPFCLYSVFSPFNKNEWIMYLNTIKKIVNNTNSGWYKFLQLDVLFFQILPYRILFCNPIAFHFPQASVFSLLAIGLYYGFDSNSITGISYVGMFVLYAVFMLFDAYTLNASISMFPVVKNAIKDLAGDEKTLYFFAGYYFDRTKILLSSEVTIGYFCFLIACLLLEPAFVYQNRLELYKLEVKFWEDWTPYRLLEDNACQKLQELILKKHPTILEFIYTKLEFCISLIF